MSLYKRLIQKYLELHRKSALFRRIVFGLAAVVVFVTVYQLIIPSITMTKRKAKEMAGISTEEKTVKVLDCGLKVHHHTKSCYKEVDGEKVLVCGQADYVIHEHDDSCYAVNDEGKRVLVCELPEIKAHYHDDDCYEEEVVLACDKEEREGHEHSDECYETETELVCDKEEHIHDDDCYTEIEDEDGEVREELTCEKEEHEHDDDCYKTTRELICDEKEDEGHTHTDECYETKKVLTCSESEPHKHTKKCYEKGHNGDPDYLICGKLEVLEHQHGEECFKTVIVGSDEEDEQNLKDQDKQEKETTVEDPDSKDKDETVLTEDTKEDTKIEENNSETQDTELGDGSKEQQPEDDKDDQEEGTDPDKDEDTDNEREESGNRHIAFSRMLTSTTGIWRRVGEGEWKRVKKNTELTRNENLMVRIAFVIPEGTMSDENAVFKYKLPENLGATERTAERVNDDDNHLNQIMEGSRLPNEEKDGSENLAGKYEMISDGADDNEEEHFHLELRFNNYTIKENASRDIAGWLVFYLKDIALATGKDGTGKIVFTKNAADGEEVAVSYTVEKEDTDEEDPEGNPEEEGAEQNTDESETQESETGAEETEETETSVPSGITYPALIFHEETDTLIVNVQAEEGALPLGTTMTVEDVDDENTLDTIREAASEKTSSSDIKYVHAVNITFRNKNGIEIEPLKPIRVSITYPETDNSEDPFVMHVDREGEATVVDQIDKSDLPAAPADNEIIFDADSFSVYAVVASGQMTEQGVTADGKTYDVTVTYGPEAEIPEGAKLKVTEFSENSSEYQEAREAVIAQKLEDDSVFDEDSFGMNAFDISILDSAGNKVEPKDTVSVSITMKSLPKEVITTEVQDSLEIQHIDASSGEAVVVTVASVDKGTIQADEDKAEAQFQLDSFSTFTVSWKRRGTNDAERTLRWRYRYNNNWSAQYLTINHIDENGRGITRPAGIGDAPQYATVTFDGLNDGVSHTFNISDLVGTIENYSFVSAYVTDLEGNNLEVTSVKGERHGNTTTITYYYGSNEVLSTSYTPQPNTNPRHDFSNPESEDIPNMTLMIQYQSSFHTTVHYGYMDENNVFHEFDEQPNPINTSTNTNSQSDGWAYLLYDFNGTETIDGKDYPFTYNYVGTYYSDNEETDPRTKTSVAPLLRTTNLQNNDPWQYYASSHGYSGTELRKANNWTNAAIDSHLYVVYKKPDIEMGGSPKLSSDTPTPKAPDILKQSRENGDGTNTLSLNITGSTSNMEVETLADVIVVFDLSSSMQRDISGTSQGSSYTNENSTSRFRQAKNAIINLANNLYAKNANGKQLIRMGLITFAGNAHEKQPLTSDKTTFINTVNNISRYEGKGTNWEHSLKLANEMGVDENRATFVIFVTDGEPTTCQTRYSISNTNMNNYVFVPGNDNGAIPDNDYTWSSGNLHNQSYYPFHFYLESGTFGLTNDNQPNSITNANNQTLSGSTMYQTASYDEVQSIVAHNKSFYVIGISNNVGTTALENLVSSADLDPEEHTYSALTSTQLTDAFDEIEKKITGILGWGDIQMTDGITELTNTISKTQMINVGDEFTYYKASAPEGWKTWSDEKKSGYMKGIEYAGKDNPTQYTSWSDDYRAGFDKGKDVQFNIWKDEERIAEKCQDAVYEGGAVKWNMGSSFMLEDGVTYRVSFICWPSQDAYDILAKCENDPSYYEEVLTDNQRSQIIRKEKNGKYVYTLKTNKEGANTTYRTATKTGNTVTPTGDPITLDFGEVPDMDLAEELIGIKKEWENILDEREFTYLNVLLGVIADNQPFANIIVNEEGGWVGSAYISTGLMKVVDGKMTVFETGHDFTITEALDSLGNTGNAGDSGNTGNAGDTGDVGDSGNTGDSGDSGTSDDTEEPAELTYHWELDAETYHPMVITDASHGYNVPTTVLLKKVTKENPGEDEYDYKIGNSYYKIESSTNNSLLATNYRRSNLNLTKNVVDKTGKNINDKYKDELFEFTIKVTDSTITTASEGDIWFSVQEAPKEGQEEGNTVFNLVTNATPEILTLSEDLQAEFHSDTKTYTYTYEGEEYTYPSAVENDDGHGLKVYTGYYYVRNSSDFKVSLKPTWNLRITNLPRQTIYTITETSKPGFECTGAVLTTKPEENLEHLEEGDFTYTPESAKVEGKIIDVNTSYKVTYTNRCDLKDIIIIKTDDKDTPKKLEGATFKLYRLNAENSYEIVGKDEAFAIPESGYTYTGLVAGTYRLVEITPPTGYVITKKQVDFTIPESSITVITLAESADNAVIDISRSDTMYVKNTPGVELPHTGGIGTIIFYLVGGLMVIGAVIPLIAKRRRYS